VQTAEVSGLPLLILGQKGVLVMFSYAGKKTIVTGAGRGIGRATALAFAQQGADVALAARTTSELEAVAEEIRQLGRQAWVFPTDMSQLEQAQALIHAAKRAMGRIDVLVNNAGGGSSIPGGTGPLEQATPAAFDAVYGLNVRSPFFAAQQAAAYMREQGTGGSIVNIVSIDGVFPAPGEALYGSAKAALVSLTETLAVEYGTFNIRVNAIAPSLIDTKLVSRHLQTEAQRLERASYFPINRVGRPEDVAAAVVYLCSDEAGWVSGVTLLVAGGQQAPSDIFRWVRRVNPVPESAKM
jgi:NAD(P)-dependent dehydrogenase (short-subunit alcohol dehydrogenase family)